jgi:hypothetical protein
MSMPAATADSFQSALQQLRRVLLILRRANRKQQRVLNNRSAQNPSNTLATDQHIGDFANDLCPTRPRQ